MALKQRTRPYELLIRFLPDGTLAAHAIDLDEVLDGDEVKFASELPARSITQAEFGSLLGAESARLVEANAIEKARTKEARDEEHKRIGELRELANAYGVTQANLQRAVTAGQQLASEHDAALKEIERLQKALAAATAKPNRTARKAPAV